MSNGNKVAIKLVESREDPRALEGEAEIYQELAGKVGIPSVYWFEQEVEYNVLVMELLGPSLEDLFNYCNRRFSLKTILLIADQAIRRIEHIHRRYIHCDIKPDNFLLGTGRQGNILYTVDFGVAKEFAGEERHLNLLGLPFGGTSRYASINNHKGLRLKAATGDKKLELIKQKKISLSGEELCQDFLPTEFAWYINYTRSLDPRDKPDYRYIRNLFRNRFQSEGFKYDHVFDWTVKRFFELHGEGG
ncbi:hypothetical protein O1611_g655 [Lasiodiplodia mahajangana]|uniref:Uncharacterized protein n=1 Tax=Lasiodiplodia mahajangana TaxID=1108764 RepID=A0ACC2JZL1_9PEZI|nr:hypothetical protein O1611_g655 [Lasiodiplodia mahajangana]